MLLELKHSKFLYFCPHTFKTFYYQYVFFKSGKIHFIDCFLECNLFEKNAAVVCHSCAFEFADLSFIDDICCKTYSEVLFLLKLLFCKISNCSKGVGKEELIAERVKFFNQIDSDETRYNYLKQQGKNDGLCDRGRGILMPYIRFVGWTSRFIVTSHFVITVTLCNT